MKTEITQDAEVIKSILCHPDIYSTIAGDNAIPADQFEPPIDNTVEYLAGFVDEKPMALMVYHQYPDKTKVHVQVLPEYRKQYAVEFGRAAMEYGNSRYGTMYADIPVCYPNVVQFARHNGFTDVGIKHSLYKKRGLLWDVLEMRYS